MVQSTSREANKGNLWDFILHMESKRWEGRVDLNVRCRKEETLKAPAR
jgi:hypothetical protein